MTHAAVPFHSETLYDDPARLSSTISGARYSLSMTDAERFSQWLRDEMTRAGIDGAELSARLGMPAGTVSRWINGHRRPSSRSAEALARVLGRPPELVLFLTGHLSRLPRPLAQYDLEREVRSLTAQMERAAKVIEGTYREEPEPSARFLGRLPANVVRWMEAKGGTDVRAIPSDWIGTRSPDEFFVVEASGESLRALGILSGDLVYFEYANGRAPVDGQLVIVRQGDEFSMNIWYRVGDWVELRDGSEKVARRFSIFDDFAVEGLWIMKRRSP